MVEIGRMAGKRMMALITDMDRPLGMAVGNALEVIEAIETLKGKGPDDLTELCLILSGAMLCLAGKGETPEACRDMAEGAIKDGSALRVLKSMIRTQGGNDAVIDDYALFGTAPIKREIRAEADGFIASTDTEGIGKASLLLGAGRNTITEPIDYTAGIILMKKTGDAVCAGDVIAVFHTSDEARIKNAEETLRRAVVISEKQPEAKPLVLDTVM